MASSPLPSPALRERVPGGRVRAASGRRFQAWLPALVLSPSVAAVLVAVYGFILFTGYLSLTNSKILPVFHLVGFANYARIWALPTWITAIENLAIYGVLYLVVTTALGLLLAILIDQKIRAEGILRPIYLYPMALSFIVTGVAWKWLLDPGIGIERSIQALGRTSFHFAWIKDPDLAIYTVVVAAVWQSSGFAMAVFLAGLRGIDGGVIEAARVDGASPLTALPPHRDPAARPVVPDHLRRADPPGDQVLRPRHCPDRRRTGTVDRVAGVVHVFLFVHPQ